MRELLRVGIFTVIFFRKYAQPHFIICIFTVKMPFFSGKTAEKISTTEIERTDKEVKRIWKILSEISDDSYARTGVYLSPHTKDMELCRALYPLEEKLF